MDVAEIVWGLVLIACGVFICIYGDMLFRFALAFMGFAIGFAAAWWALSSQSTGIQLLLSLAIGGIAAFACFALVRFGIYIAGGVLGVVAAFFISGILGVVFDTNNDILPTILAIAGIAGGGFFAPRLGGMITVMATAAAGSFLIVDGLTVWFSGQLNYDAEKLTQVLSHRFTIVLFIILIVISYMSQWQARRLRHRLLR